jgi:predicted nucleic acid-binding Zn ribbon protein
MSGDLFLDFRTVGEDHRMTAPCVHRDRWFVVQLVDGRDEVRVSDEFETLDEAREELRRLDGRGDRETVTRSTTTPVDTTDEAIAAPVGPEPAPARRCEVCEAPLPADARRQRRTCSDACRKERSRTRGAVPTQAFGR